jgi:flavorubredoxin
MQNKIINVTNNVKWIGIQDFDIVTFDIVMETQYGTTYNSYFIMQKKKQLSKRLKKHLKTIIWQKFNKCAIRPKLNTLF